MLALGYPQLHANQNVPVPAPPARSVISFASTIASTIVSWCTMTADYGVYHSPAASPYVVICFCLCSHAYRRWSTEREFSSTRTSVFLYQVQVLAIYPSVLETHLDCRLLATFLGPLLLLLLPMSPYGMLPFKIARPSEVYCTAS